MFEDTKALTLPFLIVAVVFVAAEVVISFRRAEKFYSLKDTLCNLAIFAGNRLSQPLFVAYIFGTLRYMENWHLVTFPSTVLTGFAAFVLTDFAYYWEHRLSHKTKYLWFFHEVHHSSRNFNLTTSFRLHWLGRLTAPLIFGPLILLGFKANQLVLFFTVNLFYQFFLHTKLVGQLGFLEGIINTPSAHRVHHARNPQYIDRNFGGVLMIWDRLFGTYAPEVTTPVFGIIGKFESSNPLVVHFHNLPFYSTAAKQLNKLFQVAGVTSVLVIMLALTQSVAFADQDGSDNQTRTLTLKGGVDFQESSPTTRISDVRGLWKGHVLELGRHPTVRIEEQVGSNVKGTYSGLIGKFPLTGVFDQASGAIRLSVDFSGSRLVRLRHRNAVAVLTGQLVDDTISGIANIPELSTKSVHFEARKAGQ